MIENIMLAISLYQKGSKPLKVSPALYGAIVNCVGLRATISHVGEIKNNKEAQIRLNIDFSE